jgi:subtilisin-like proprotein convertase family protein
MKTSIEKATVVIVVLMAAVGVAHATLITDSWSGSQDVPDGSPVGIANSLTISGSSGTIQDVSVDLTISGGYNGDLYGYLVFQPTGGGSAATEVLLNQIGTSPSNPLGESGAGFNVTLSDIGTVGNGNGGDIHDATGSPVTGIYTPDSLNTLDNTFAGLSANGTWTLFLADLTEGGGTGTMTGWGVGISVVPEPATWALVVFAIGALTLKLAGRRWPKMLTTAEKWRHNFQGGKET